MKLNNNTIFYLLLCPVVLFGCDGYFRRQAVIDFQKNTPKNFSVVAKTDLNKLFSIIETIAKKNNMKCYSYSNKEERCLVWGASPINLNTHIQDEKVVKIELVQFGPLAETKTFTAIEEDLASMLNEEFPGQNIQMANPAKKQ